MSNNSSTRSYQVVKRAVLPEPEPTGADYVPVWLKPEPPEQSCWLKPEPCLPDFDFLQPMIKVLRLMTF